MAWRWLWVGFLVFTPGAGSALPGEVPALSVLTHTPRHFGSHECKGGWLWFVGSLCYLLGCAGGLEVRC